MHRFQAVRYALSFLPMLAQEDAIYELSQASSVKALPATTPSSTPIKLFSAGPASISTVFLSVDLGAAWASAPSAPPGWRMESPTMNSKTSRSS